MAPGLVGPEKAGKGKAPTDVLWCTVAPTNGPERTGYPTQKPFKLIKWLLQPACPPGGWVLDFFAGSGTTGAAAKHLGLNCVLIDENPDAIKVMKARLNPKPEAVKYD